MTVNRFDSSIIISHNGYEFELVPEGAFRRVELLDGLREDVLRIAAASRGWHDPADLEFFRAHFKIDPLYEANSLVLVREGGSLIGLAGAVNDWHTEIGSIVHVCSLGLLPRIQGRGLPQVFLGLLWLLNLADEDMRRDYLRQRLFTTAITQSPYILWLMQRLSETYPSPSRVAPSPDEVQVARWVVERFDPHLDLDEADLILRNECLFRYKKTPYSLDRAVNTLCDAKLRYDEGDVFVVVGRVTPGRLQPFLDHVRGNHPKDLEALSLTLRPVLEGAPARSSLRRSHGRPRWRNTEDPEARTSRESGTRVV